MILYETANLPIIPFLQISHKQPRFFSEVFIVTINKHINSPGTHIRTIERPMREITNQPQSTTLNTCIRSFQLPQKHYHQLNFF